jgi:thiamine kinase-like enzyme
MQELEGRIAKLPVWSGPVRLTPLPGGISNLSFTATDHAGRYVVRVTRDFPFHHVFRDREVMSARAAHTAGFAPEIVHAEPGLTVSRYVEGEVLDAAGVRANISRIAELIRRFHRDMPAGISGAGFIFWVFHVNRDYVRQLANDPRAERWLAINAELEAAQLPLPIAFGHHDLLPANLIDDGHRLWLIDYEYAGFGTAMFDLGNLSSNAHFAPDHSAALLDAYFRAPPAENLLRSHAAMEAASLLREALWSLVSVGRLDRPGVDYAAYADLNFARLETALTDFHHRFGA